MYAGKRGIARIHFASKFMGNKISTSEWHHRCGLNTGENSISVFLHRLGYVQSLLKVDLEAHGELPQGKGRGPVLRCFCFFFSIGL